jgi:hypothetical protein
VTLQECQKKELKLILSYMKIMEPANSLIDSDSFHSFIRSAIAKAYIEGQRAEIAIHLMTLDEIIAQHETARK